jgi:hypothetical protein
MNDVEDKTDIARANSSDPMPWMVIVLVVATLAAVGIFLFKG